MLRNLFYLALIFTMFQSCLPKPTITSVVYQSGGVMLKPKFKDGTKVETMEVEKKGDKYFVYRKAKDSLGNCLLSRSEVVPVSQGKDTVFVMPLKGKTENCFGDGCPHCEFHPSDNETCICAYGNLNCNYEKFYNYEIMAKY